MTYTDDIATCDRACEICSAVIVSGSAFVLRQVPGIARSKRVLCPSCGAKGRDEESAKPAPVAASARTAAPRARRAPRVTIRRSNDLSCRCANCTSGRESLCLRD